MIPTSELTQHAFTSSKLTIETLEQSEKYVKVNNKGIRWRQWRRSGVFIVNF